MFSKEEYEIFQRNVEIITSDTFVKEPTEEDLMLQSINQIICESCYLYDQCSRINCIRNPKELKALRKSMLEFLKKK